METAKTAKQEALSFLDKKDRTIFEVEQFLEKSGWEEDVIEETITFLTDKKILNDSRFAELYAIEMLEKGKSCNKIAGALSEKGVPVELIEEVLDRIEAHEGEAEKGKREIEKILAKESLSIKTMRKIFTRLAYLGFSEELITELTAPLAEKLENL